MDTLTILLLFWRRIPGLIAPDFLFMTGNTHRECRPVLLLLPGTGLPLPDGAGLGRGEGRRDEDTE